MSETAQKRDTAETIVWPSPNANGVYARKRPTLVMEDGSGRASIWVLQVSETRWISCTEVWSGGTDTGCGGWSEPLSRSPQYRSHAAAKAAALRMIIERADGHTRAGSSASAKKHWGQIARWAKGVLLASPRPPEQGPGDGGQGPGGAR
jgi:hypothetical protein